MRRFHLAVITLLFHKHDMETVLCTEDLADGTHGRVVHRLFEWIDISERRDPTQLAACLLHTRVGAHFARHIGKSLHRLTALYLLPFAFHFFPFNFHFTQRHTDVCIVDLRQCLCLGGTVGTRRALNSYMCGTTVLGHVTVTQLDEAVHRCFVLQVLRRSLCAVALQLLGKRLGRVNTLTLRFRYFEFEIDEHVQILVHRLRINGTCLVVLLIDVQKLLCTHGLAVDGHQSLFLCHDTHAHGYYS